MATDEQAAALAAFGAKRNVVLSALPGTGKSWTIVQACHAVKQRVLVLAYNTELAGELTGLVERDGLSARVTVHTFHSLCSHCVRLSADDQALLEAVEDAERDPGACVTRLGVDAVMIDEAQDVNELHLRALACCVQGSKLTQYLVAGDSHQLLYDYGEFPSSGALLAAPEALLPSLHPWTRASLRVSHRLTPPVAQLVRAIFHIDARSAAEGGDAPGGVPVNGAAQGGVADGAAVVAAPAPVTVHACHKWAAGRLVAGVLRDAARARGVPLGAAAAATHLLVATRASNAPLTAALNDLSAAGVALFVQGADGKEPRVRDKKLRVSTWHSAKGTEGERVVVLLPARCKPRPLFVALTRARAELHLVFLQGDVCAPLAKSVGALAAARRCAGAAEQVEAAAPVRFADDAAFALCAAALRDTAVAPYDFAAPLDEAPRARRATISFDRWRCDARVARYARYEEAAAPPEGAAPDSAERAADGALVEGCGGHVHDASAVYERAALACVEHARTGVVRAMEDVLAPVRLAPDGHADAIRQGNVARFVSPRVQAATLLPADLRDVAAAAYARAGKTAEDWCAVALGLLAWNAYHHTMRQLLPLTWVDAARHARMVRRVECALPPAEDGPLHFDVRLHVTTPQGSLLHSRAHAASAHSAWHLVWTEALSSSHKAEACVRARLHPSKRCTLVALDTLRAVEVHVRDEEEMTRALED